MVYWKFEKEKGDDFVSIVNEMKPELAKEKAQE
jgi:hypothetical protein